MRIRSNPAGNPGDLRKRSKEAVHFGSLFRTLTSSNKDTAGKAGNGQEAQGLNELRTLVEN